MPQLEFPVDSPKWFSKEEDEKLKKSGFLWSPPADARFPQQSSAARECFINFVDYYRCKNLLGEDYTACEYFKRVYKTVCPNFMVEKWEGWVAEGRFPAHFDR